MSPSVTNVLDRATLVPIGLLVAVVLAASGGAWQLSATLNEFDRRQLARDKELALKFQRIELQLQHIQDAATATDDLWGKPQMRAFADRLRDLNKGKIEVPEVK